MRRALRRRDRRGGFRPDRCVVIESLFNGRLAGWQQSWGIQLFQGSCKHVATVQETGSIAASTHFGIAELATDTLSDRMKGEPVESEDFWRWSSQITRGVADIHRIGLIHRPQIMAHGLGFAFVDFLDSDPRGIVPPVFAPGPRPKPPRCRLFWQIWIGWNRNLGSFGILIVCFYEAFSFSVSWIRTYIFDELVCLFIFE